jgi:hypothetical protein
MHRVPRQVWEVWAFNSVDSIFSLPNRFGGKHFEPSGHLRARKLMNLIVAILRFLLGAPPEERVEVQLVPVRGHVTARQAKFERSVRCFWVPGVGWFVLHPELRHRNAVSKWLAVKQFLAFIMKGGGRFRRTVSRT